MYVINSLEKAEAFVVEQQELGVDVRWDGWDLVFFKADRRGLWDTQSGAVRNGQYGFDNRFPVTHKGTWEVDGRNVRHSKTRR